MRQIVTSLCLQCYCNAISTTTCTLNKGRIRMKNMASSKGEDNLSHTTDTSSSGEYESDDCGSFRQNSDEEEEDMILVSSQYVPYVDEPLAASFDTGGGIAEVQDTESQDLDGLTPGTLAARQDGVIPLDSWCQCEHCHTENLDGATEYRCCREVVDAWGKMAFDGSIENIKCITEHEDYGPMSNKTVLLQVAPLLRNKDGTKYKRRAGTTENDFVRSVAYRWLIRWLCGYIGWDNRRPLPACIYENLRTKYYSGQTRGYMET